MEKHKRATVKNPLGFKDHVEAWKKADEQYPPTKETLDGLIGSHGHICRFETKNDIRFFVLFNHLRHIANQLDRSKEHTFLERIQDNILHAAEKFMK